MYLRFYIYSYQHNKKTGPYKIKATYVYRSVPEKRGGSNSTCKGWATVNNDGGRTPLQTLHSRGPYVLALPDITEYILESGTLQRNFKIENESRIGCSER